MNDNRVGSWAEVESVLSGLAALRCVYFERNPIYTEAPPAYRRYESFLALPLSSNRRQDSPHIFYGPPAFPKSICQT